MLGRIGIVATAERKRTIVGIENAPLVMFVVAALVVLPVIQDVDDP
jgi:hypothetical protein